MRVCVLLLGWAVCLGVAGAARTLYVTAYPGETATVLWTLDHPTRLTDGNMRIHSTRSLLFHCFISHHIECDYFNNRAQILVKPEDAQHFTLIPAEAVGFTLTNVTVEDATRYGIVVYGDDYFRGYVVLYCLLKPTQPSVVYTQEPILGRDLLITCNTSSRSEPREYNYRFPMQYTWTVTLLGSPYRIQTNGSLLIDNVQKSDTGAAISCHAREENSTLMSDESPVLILDVHYLDQIQFSDGLDHEEVRSGSTVTKTCQASCNPDCSYQWVDGTDTQITQGPDLVLMDVSDVTASKVYICQATNTAGTLTKRYRLTLVYPPVIFNLDISPVVTFQGNRTTLSCTLKTATEATMGLFHAAMEITGDVFGNKLEHTWETVDCTQNGNYECRAENDDGATSRNVTLNVQCPPRMALNASSTLTPRKFKVTLGSEFTFTIKLISNPFPEVTDVNLEHLSDNGIHRSISRDVFSVSIANPDITVTIQAITEANYGVYTLSARNQYGHMLALFQITAPDPGPSGSVIGISTAFGLVLAAGLIIGTIWLLRKKISKANQGGDENTTEADQPTYENTAFTEAALRADSAAAGATYDNLGPDKLGLEVQPSYETLSRPDQAPESDTTTTYEEVRYDVR